MRAPRQRTSTRKESESAATNQQADPAEPATKRRKLDEKDTSVSAQVKQIRSELVFGLNQVTRGLEHDALKLVLVSKDIQASLVIQHLPVLAQLHRVPLCVLTLTSEQLGAIFGLRTVIAMGVKVSVKRAFARTVLTGVTEQASTQHATTRQSRRTHHCAHSTSQIGLAAVECFE